MLFPKWFNAIPTIGAMAAGGGGAAVVAGYFYYFTPEYWEVGYMPNQPGAGFNHQIHAGKLGIDCRYCHTNVEKSPEANIPHVAVCYGCHAENRLGTLFDPQEQVEFVRTAYANDEPIPWVRIHKLPDYVRNFPHHVHVKAGVSCYSCHGQIAAMPVVYQAEGLSMNWCLECHRAPEESLVPPDKVTDLIWVEQEMQARRAGGGEVDTRALLTSLREAPPENCGACHH